MVVSELSLNRSGLRLRSGSRSITTSRSRHVKGIGSDPDPDTALDPADPAGAAGGTCSLLAGCCCSPATSSPSAAVAAVVAAAEATAEEGVCSTPHLVNANAAPRRRDPSEACETWIGKKCDTHSLVYE